MKKRKQTLDASKKTHPILTESFFDNRIVGRNGRSETSLARSKVWDWSMRSLEVALDREVHLRVAQMRAKRALLASLMKEWSRKTKHTSVNILGVARVAFKNCNQRCPTSMRDLKILSFFAISKKSRRPLKKIKCGKTRCSRLCTYLAFHLWKSRLSRLFTAYHPHTRICLQLFLRKPLGLFFSST